MGDLLISGSEILIEYITQRMKEKFDVGRYEENEATYGGMKISKINDNDFSGLILDSDKYGDKINHIEISHGRTRTPEEPITEAGHAISRSELGKLIWTARIARPGAIYEASADAQTFPDGEIIEVLERDFGNGEKISRMAKRNKIPNTCRGLSNS